MPVSGASKGLYEATGLLSVGATAVHRGFCLVGGVDLIAATGDATVILYNNAAATSAGRVLAKLKIDVSAEGSGSKHLTGQNIVAGTGCAAVIAGTGAQAVVRFAKG